MKIQTKTILSFLLLGSILAPLSVLAGTVSKAKDKKVIIDSDGDSYSVGDRFFLVDENDKKKGLVEITQVKGDKAAATLIKGKAEEGMTLTASSSPKSKGGGRAKTAYGGLASIVMSTMSIKSQNANLSGNSFDLLGFYQSVIDKKISLRILGGYNTLSVKGTRTGGESASVSLGYLGGSALIRYSFTEGAFQPWAGGGISFLVPISKSSNVLDLGKVSTNQAVLISGGFDYSLNKKAFIPVQLSYAILPNSADVSTNQIMITGGYGINF